MADMTGELSEIEKQVRARVSEESVSEPEKGKAIDTDFVLACLEANETGDGALYARLMQGRFLYIAAQDGWLEWQGHHWELDEMSKTEEAVERLAEKYLEVADEFKAEVKKMGFDISAEAKNEPPEIGYYRSQYKALKKRVHNVRTTNRAAKILRKAHVNSEIKLAIKGNEIDQSPWLLALKNGVINLKTGELEPGRREDYLLKSSPVEWQGIDAPCPQWEKALLEIFSGDETLVAFLQRLLGMGLIGEIIQAVFAVMTGQGRNGKSMIVETICKALGPMAGPIRAEMLLDQFRTNSAGPSADIMSLRGHRMVFASEPDENTRISSSRVKWLTGNDRLSGRAPHDKRETSFIPTHTTFLLANEVPKTPPQDFAFWERTFIIPFDLSFVNRQPTEENEVWADEKLPKKLEEELPGILSWMVRGCLEYQAMGLNAPPRVIQTTDAKRRDDDLIQDFIDYCCILKPGRQIGASQLYNAFEAWWGKFIGKKCPKQKKFGTLMVKKQGITKEKSGIYYYYGISLNDGAEKELFPPEAT